MQCNIDQRGRRVRMAWGVITLLIGLVIVILILADQLTGRWPWIVSIALIALGILGIFEARKGWCVVRAMGFKTPV